MKIYQGKTIDLKYLYIYYRRNFSWFRLFGKGLSFKNTNYEKLSFSERIGKRKYLQINNWVIKYID